MNFRTRRAATASWLSLTAAVLFLVAAVAAYAGEFASRAGAAATLMPQDVTRIESRLSLLEQRFYSIETSIRGLEQQSRLSAGATAGRAAREPEVGLLRAEIETLRHRLAEIECGLARVDERTLTSAAKESRRKSGGETADPCRLNADSPLRLSGRP